MDFKQQFLIFLKFWKEGFSPLSPLGYTLIVISLIGYLKINNVYTQCIMFTDLKSIVAS